MQNRVRSRKNFIAKTTLNDATSAKTQYAETGGRKIAYRSIGEGTPIILANRFGDFRRPRNLFSSTELVCAGEKTMRIRIKHHSAAYWRVTLDNPPLNLFDQEMSGELQGLIKELEEDDKVQVVVFDSVDPDYFMAHLDLVRTAELSLKLGPTGLSPFPDFLRRLEQAPFVTVGVLRGRARGVGSEFLLGLDMRFASCVASFDRKPIALAKKIINERVGLVPAPDLAETQKKFFKTLTWPKTQARVASLLERGLQQRGDFELRLGHHLGPQ